MEPLSSVTPAAKFEPTPRRIIGVMFEHEVRACWFIGALCRDVRSYVNAAHGRAIHAREPDAWGLYERASNERCWDHLADFQTPAQAFMSRGDREDFEHIACHERYKRVRGSFIVVQTIQHDCVGGLIDERDENAARVIAYATARRLTAACGA